MALTLINRTARRVGIACTATDTAYFYPDAGYRAFTTGAGHPARIMPPRGVWEVTITSDSLYDASPSLGAQRVTPTGGRIRFTRYYTGDESMLIRTTEQGATCTVVLEEAPPPCVIAFWRVWGWHRGANQNRRARQRAHRHRDGCTRFLGALGHLPRVGELQRMEPAGTTCGEVPLRTTRRENRRVRGRLLYWCAGGGDGAFRGGHLVRLLGIHRNHHPARLTPAGGEHGGA